MSNVQSRRRAYKHMNHRRLRRPSVKKSLNFNVDSQEDVGVGIPAHDKFDFDASRANPGPSHPEDFWAVPPPPTACVNTETTVNRRSLRLRTKNQFAFSQIADSPKLHGIGVTTSDHVLTQKKEDIKLQHIDSDYNSASECSMLYFQPSSSSSSTARNKGSQSLGYCSDLDEVMSNLSIDETVGVPSEFRQWESQEEISMEEDDGNRDSHLSLDDLKISSLRASLKIHDEICFLIPMQGYQISPKSKVCRSLNFSALRYDLRNRPSSMQLENMIRIETLHVSLEEYFLKAGLRIFQVSPIISIQPHEVKFVSLCPAIVQIPLNLDPSPGDEVHCLYSRSPVEDIERNYSSICWSSEMAGKCSIMNGKVNFEIFQFGVFVLVIRPKCPYSSSMKNIRARVGGKLIVPNFPHVEVVFPKEVTDLDVLKVNAKVYFDTEESVKEFLSNREHITDPTKSSFSDCLATPIIQLEPHGITFEGDPVMVTLPVPDYDKIVSLFGEKAKLSIWESNTHCNEPSSWKRMSVEYNISQSKSQGEVITVVTFPVSHFSFFKGVWEAISEYLYDAKIGMLYYFVSFAMKCQAHMQEYPDQPSITSSKSCNTDNDDANDTDKLNKPIKGGSRFGLEVTVFQADKTWPQMATYKYKVGQSNPKLVKPGKLCVALKSHYFEPDIQAGEEEEMVKEEPDFRGRDFEKQFICKFKPEVNIERGPFGKVLVTRYISSRQKPQPIFEFNLQKCGNEGDVEEHVDKHNEEWSMVALTELANSLFVTEGDNWKTFAKEIGMTRQEIKDAKLKSDSQPFQKIVNHYRQRGGTPQELVDALYRCHRTLKVGHYLGQSSSNNTRSSNGSSGRGSLSDNNAHASRFGSHDSDTSGTQTSQDSGIPSGRKRSHHSSYRGSGGASGSQSVVSKSSKRKRLSLEPGPSSSNSIRIRHLDTNPVHGDVDSTTSHSDSESDVSGVGSMTENEKMRNSQFKLSNQFMWKMSDRLNTARWRDLGRTLGVEETILIDVDHVHSKTSFRECAYQMLLAWKQRFPKTCVVGTLYSALEKEGMVEAAKAMSDIITEVDSLN